MGHMENNETLHSEIMIVREANNLELGTWIIPVSRDNTIGPLLRRTRMARCVWLAGNKTCQAEMMSSLLGMAVRISGNH
jgi:hypothetical protein